MDARVRYLSTLCLLGLLAGTVRAERPSLSLALVEAEQREPASALAAVAPEGKAVQTQENAPAAEAELEARGALAMRETPPEPEKHRTSPQHRFSDGPRNVARARGASLARAEALGIGGHATTQKLLWNRPGPELLAAVPGKPPKNLLWPVVAGTWGRGFGFTRKIRTDLRHNGIDIGAPEGASVRAAADGLVIYSDNTLTGLGNAVMILHPGGWTTLYGHNQRTTVQAGYYVKRGERIALVGHTGMAWGPHLHFEFRDNGRWRDPEALITGCRDLELSGLLVELKPSEPEPKLDPKRDAKNNRPQPTKKQAPAQPASAPRSSAPAAPARNRAR